MSEHTRELVVEWSYAGAWLVVLLIGAGVSWWAASRPAPSYRVLVPVLGAMTAACVVGGIAIAAAVYPS